MVLFKKLKTADNTSDVTVENLEIRERLTIPRLTTIQRDALNPTNGMIIYNTTTNKQEGYINGSWEVVVTGSGGGFVDLTTDQTVTGLKTFDNDIRFTLANNRHLLWRNDGLDVFGITHTNSSPFCMRFITSDDVNPRCIESGYYTTNNRANAWNRTWAVNQNGLSPATMEMNSNIVLTDNSLLPNSADLQIGSNTNFRLSGVGLRLGSTVGPAVSLLDLVDINPTLRMSGATNTLMMSGSTTDIIDFSGTSNIAWVSGQQTIQVRNGSSSTFAGFDYINNNMSIGLSAITLPNALLNMKDATKQKYMCLPFVNNANEPSLPTSTDYYGGLYYQEDRGEITALLNGVKVDLVHKSTTGLDVTALHDASVSNVEFGHLNGVTSSIQPQIDNKVTLDTAQTITAIKTCDAGLHIKNGEILRFRNDFVGSNPDLHCMRYLAGTECLAVVTTDNAVPTGVCFGYHTGDNKANPYITRAEIKYNNTADSAVLILNGDTVLNKTTLGSNIINASLITNNSDSFEVLGQTAVDASFKVTRSTGEFLNISSRVGGAYLSNTTKDLVEINNATLEVKTGMGINISDVAMSYNIGGSNVIEYDITTQDFGTNSTSYVVVCTFLYRSNRPFNIITGISSGGAASQQWRLVNVSAGITTLAETVVLPAGINGASVAITGATPLPNSVLQVQCRKVTGGGSINCNGFNIS